MASDIAQNKTIVGCWLKESIKDRELLNLHDNSSWNHKKKHARTHAAMHVRSTGAWLNMWEEAEGEENDTPKPFTAGVETFWLWLSF